MPPSKREPRTDVQVTVDLVIFTVREDQLQVLLIERGLPPFEGRWALPGGFIREGESLEHAALRELAEETGVRDVYLEQLFTFGDPGRDPRGRVVTVAYYALIASDRAPLVASTDARAARWWPVAKHPPLAFDHEGILEYAVERLRNKLEYTTVGFQLLPRHFTLTELQRVYEAILGRPLDKRNFRRKLALLGILKPVKGRRAERGRPAQLYEFSGREFSKLKDVGIIFPF
ncbi:MAG TPA: NUDIX domain-containing protein [Gemmatimonadales bacterium]|nr:NUDIX domain-containing protein [Gemmatimonadales bacterium]